MNKKQELLNYKSDYFRSLGVEWIDGFIKTLEERPWYLFNSNWADKYIKMFKKAKEAIETNNNELFNEVYSPEFLWLDCQLAYLRDISVKSYKINTTKED